MSTSPPLGRIGQDTPYHDVRYPREYQRKNDPEDAALWYRGCSVSIQISLNMSQGMAPIVLRMPISWILSWTDIKYRIDDTDHCDEDGDDGYREHHDLCGRDEFHDGLFDLRKAHDLDIRKVCTASLRGGRCRTPFFSLMPISGYFTLFVEYFLQRPEGHKDGAVILCACPVRGCRPL